MSTKKRDPIGSAKSSRHSASKPEDVSKRKRTDVPSEIPDARPKKLNHTYALLSNVNQTIVRMREQKESFEAACRIAVEQGGFRMAWIGLLDPQTKQVRPGGV